MAKLPVRIAAAGLLFALPLAGSAALADGPRMPAVISVTADGDATLVPDMATVSLSVVSQADDTATALSDNSTAMQKVIDALKADGIEDKDIQTSNFSVSPRYEQVTASDGSMTTEIVGYEVQNGLDVRVRDLSKLSGVLDEAVKLGVNSGGGIAFSNSDPTAAEDEARREAVANALAKAETLAEAAGVTLGKVVSISEQGSMPRPMMMRGDMMMAKAESAPPIAAGENTYSITVNISLEIDQ
ncbi:SIMPL domain-containing protein [Martelella limonii]|uniref:SIMPL domain-containing protein n=1 Tax=Martelella limonii TaxID=1647649 RepID=UPI00158120CF|nr:SIMPL domain-containing protein [Martelella limonii]